MFYHCYGCGKAVTSPLPEDSVVRAILICPECLEQGKITIPDPPRPRDPEAPSR